MSLKKILTLMRKGLGWDRSQSKIVLGKKYGHESIALENKDSSMYDAETAANKHNSPRLDAYLLRHPTLLNALTIFVYMVYILALVTLPIALFQQTSQGFYILQDNYIIAATVCIFACFLISFLARLKEATRFVIPMFSTVVILLATVYIVYTYHTLCSDELLLVCSAMNSSPTTEPSTLPDASYNSTTTTTTKPTTKSTAETADTTATTTKPRVIVKKDKAAGSITTEKNNSTDGMVGTTTSTASTSKPQEIYKNNEATEKKPSIGAVDRKIIYPDEYARIKAMEEAAATGTNTAVEAKTRSDFSYSFIPSTSKGKPLTVAPQILEKSFIIFHDSNEQVINLNEEMAARLRLAQARMPTSI